MAKWLEPLEQALDQRIDPMQFFFRDDDAGWGGASLFHLLDCFQESEAPIDLAAIPTALDPVLGDSLLKRLEESQYRIGVHQHGFSHADHQQQGRKCEFGETRSNIRQKIDIAAGKRLMSELFGQRVDPIFTPPWNRCSQTTVDILVELEFKALSRDFTARPLGTEGLQELPVHIDWLKKRDGERLGLEQLGRNIAQSCRDNCCAGIMLHHEKMDESDRTSLTELLGALTTHGTARLVRMNTLLGAN